jgi:CarD family transcriptional regulator
MSTKSKSRKTPASKTPAKAAKAVKTPKTAASKASAPKRAAAARKAAPARKAPTTAKKAAATKTSAARKTTSTRKPAAGTAARKTTAAAAEPKARTKTKPQVAKKAPTATAKAKTAAGKKAGTTTKSAPKKPAKTTAKAGAAKSATAKSPATKAAKRKAATPTKAAAAKSRVTKRSAKPTVTRATPAEPAAKATKATTSKTARKPALTAPTGSEKTPSTKARLPAQNGVETSMPAKKPTTRSEFKTGEFIVYPAHGVGRIAGIDTQEVAGIKLDLFVINFVKDKMTLRVPVPKATAVGMRKLAEPATVKKALETVRGRARIKRTMWSRRAQEYEAKINSGDLIAIAEVVRDLFRSDTQPEQSYSERQLYEAALDRMSREISSVSKISETEAIRQIEQNLAKSPRRGAPKAEGTDAQAA